MLPKGKFPAAVCGGTRKSVYMNPQPVVTDKAPAARVLVQCRERGCKRKGGLARKKNLTKEQLSEIGKAGAWKRWAKKDVE
jgi:hypothetical protein